MPPVSSFRHIEESTRSSPPHEAVRTWLRICERHLGSRLWEIDRRAEARLHVRDDDRFEGRARSGRVGRLHYTRLWISQGCYEQRCTSHAVREHVLLLCVKGIVEVTVAGLRQSMSAGDFLLVRDLRQVRFAHERPVELIVLFNPLSADTLERLGDRPTERRPARSDNATMLARWLQEVCENRGWQSPALARSVDVVVRRLLQEVMLDPGGGPCQRLERVAIEWEVTRRLQDPTLNLAGLAHSFGCSLRTLHRVFRRGGDESLERYIQRQRIEACAAKLRRPRDAELPTLTDLALQFGFASSSHFSTAFRTHFGVSPSSYQRLHAG